MRWLILTQYYAPEQGAPQIRLRELAKQLRSRGHDVRVLTALPNYPAGRIFDGYAGRAGMTEEIDGIPVKRTWVYAGTGRSPFVRLANYFSFTASALVAGFAERRPDILFVESQPLSLGVVALAMHWLRGVPYVYNVPDLQVDVAREMSFVTNGAALRVARWMEDRFLRHSLSVSTVTERFIDHLVSRGVKRSHVSFLPNGADPEKQRPLPPDPEMLDRFDLRGQKVFAYVGTHAYYHGLDTLLDVAHHLKDRSDISLLLIGDGPERDRLRREAVRRNLRNVIFGNSPVEEMARLYSIVHAAVVTLRDMEVARMMRLSKVYPALSCGVPVIYSGRGESASLLETHDCGRVVEPEKPLELARAIRALADDSSARERMSKNGRALVEKQFTWSDIVERWLKELPAPTRHPRA